MQIVRGQSTKWFPVAIAVAALAVVLSLSHAVEAFTLKPGYTDGGRYTLPVEKIVPYPDPESPNDVLFRPPVQKLPVYPPRDRDWYTLPVEPPVKLIADRLR